MAWIGVTEGVARGCGEQHEVDARGWRIRGNQEGHREAGVEAQGAYRIIRRGQREEVDGQARDCGHEVVLVGSGEQGGISASGARHGEGREGILRGQAAGVEHGSIRGDGNGGVHDHLVEPLGKQVKLSHY